MKKYIGTKQIEATPMTLGAYNEYRGWKLPEDEDPNTEGYLVEYTDGGKPNDERHEGYISWSPKDVFEKAYQVAETFMDRLNIEGHDLAEKLSKCSAFVHGEKFREIVKDDYQAFLLQLQEYFMEVYFQIICVRVHYASGKGETQPMVLGDMTFGTAVEALRLGFPVCRKGWNGKGMFVVKQIPAHITEEIIPKMQSLPQSAKDILMARETKVIDYTNQMLIIHPDGRADSWVPSSSDVFAEDWQIFRG